MSRRLAQAALISAMAVGSLLMWTAVPAAWLWIGGRFSRVSQSDMTSIAIVLTGIPATMIAVGHGLSRLDQRYTDVYGPGRQQRVAGARWLHSLRGGHDEEPVTMLDKIMVINVAAAILTAAVWFLFFSQGSQAPRGY